MNSIIKLMLKYSQLITQSENLLANGLVVVEIESETAIRLRRKEKIISGVITKSNTVQKNGRTSYVYRKCFGSNDILDDR